VLEIVERVNESKDAPLTESQRRGIQRWLTLPYPMRQKSRFRARLDDGEEASVLLARGAVLRHGDVLVAANGTLVGVRAAEELVSIATAPDAISALRAAYHLGNRHVALQIRAEKLVYLHDHVLDAMLSGLGLSVTQGRAAFEPEPGAYQGHAHARGSHAHEERVHSEPRSEQRIRSERPVESDANPALRPPESQAKRSKRDESEITTVVELLKPSRRQ
jgi:urease accessory protein